MKGGVVYPGKRRWRFLVIGVLFLVVLSMLVPLVFLLGFHSTGYLSDRPNSDSGSVSDAATGDHSTTSKGQSNTKEIIDHALTITANVKGTLTSNAPEARNMTGVSRLDDGHSKRGTLVPPHSLSQPVANRNNNKPGTADVDVVEENSKQCEENYGSYCSWHDEHKGKEDMKDAMIKKLKDQLFVARAYYPSIAKLPAENKLTQEIKRNIQELERILSESTTDTDLPQQIVKISQKVQRTVTKAKSHHVECHNVDKKFRQILDATIDEAKFHMKQSAFLYQLTVGTMPKSLHCLSLRLTVEFFNSSLHDTELSVSEKFSDPMLHHYVMISNNILASSVVINSTVTHARDSGKLVFHVLTDEQNYFAMKLWFSRCIYREAAIQVVNIEHLDQDSHYKSASFRMTLPVEFRVAFRNVDDTSATSSKMEYLSVFSDTHFLLPYIFQNLKKIIVLDDDVVVQRDLSDLWDLNLRGKVNSALESCSVRLGRLTRYLGDSYFNKNSCAWMSGLNIIDLARWRELNLTQTYRKLGQHIGKQNESFEASALRASLLTFQDQIYALDDAWALSGLGHDYELDAHVIRNAAVLHYNGKRKPWLELGISKYKHYWKGYLNWDDRFLTECNVH
ncbi:probable galacturonosyltransferase 7 [Euphorbia lathyris]|uniref:probable galacturonosyltransferase 7 n=1 Tax=Euphorbia lathyris TaxID=212925 RepID=UPI0033138E5C